MKSLPRDGVGIHKRAVRRARDSEERAVDDGGRGFVYGESGRHAKARGIRRVDMLRPVREDWLQTEDIEPIGTPATRTMPQPRKLRSLRPGVFASCSWSADPLRLHSAATR